MAAQDSQVAVVPAEEEEHRVRLELQIVLVSAQAQVVRGLMEVMAEVEHQANMASMVLLEQMAQTASLTRAEVRVALARGDSGFSTRTAQAPSW